MELLLLALLAAILATRLIWQQYRAPTQFKHAWFNDVLLNSEDLVKHARELGRSHKPDINKKRYNILRTRLQDNFQFISYAYREANSDARSKKIVSHSAQWLLDNFYIIEEQVKEIRQQFTHKQYRDLRVLKNTVLRGYPRVYVLALELVSHTDGKLDEQTLIDFVNAYQSEAKLTTAEIWSLSLMIRIALVEKIRFVCERLEAADKQWKQVQNDLERLTVGHWPEYINTWNDYSSAYVEHLLERLRRSKTDTREITVALERKLQEFDTDINSVVHREHQAQAARTIAMSNSIISLKLVGSLDWNDVFEAMSPVDKILSSDLWYKKMDFESRDYYRHRIEDLARRFRTSETRIARKLMNCRQPEAAEPRLAHVGYYLLDKGRAKLFRELGQSPGARWRPGIGSYLLLIVLISFALTWALGLWVFGSLAWRLEILALLLALVPASELAITFVNWVITHSLRPAILPKLEFRDGLPSEAATLVVVPALLTDAKRSRELVEQLAVHYLANPEENLFFALLGDFKDSPDETSAKDQEIIDIVRAGIRELNAKFAPEQDKFFYLHRRREFNNKQGKWMGWERKRGALDELNALLTGSGETSFVVGKDDLQGLKIRYVLTLDADTRLPMDAARLLVGAIAHPLHQAKVERGLVREGYGLIQPRIGVSAESANGSRFARIMVGSGGIDAYTTAVSDLYQDLFGEGIYTGKGIYDVQAYQAVLAGTLPENRVLSHDLLEGSFLRTGLATDLELIDDFPGRYSAYMMRLHRWTRGDWQLLPWLGPHVRDQAGKRRRNPLTLLSRWKIADNLRRSLVPVSLIALFILGLTLLPGILPWLLLPAVTLALPALLALLDRGLMPGRVVGPQSSLLTGPAAAVSQLLLQLAFLPYHAYLMTDAILRTLWRLLVSRRNLLEWTTAADVERTLKNDSASYLRRNRPVLIFVGLSALLFFYIAPLHVIAALPYYALWLLSPLLATWVSGNRRQTQFLEEADIRLLRRLARKIWNYYEDTAGAEANWLPPDNLQIEPPNGIDNRTSPTNIGFLLISALGARDMGYISTTRVTELVDRTLSSVERLEKWHGHLFNWYDTNSLKVLRPRYVSTVDSGNLVAFLIALREGLQEYLEARLVDSRLWKGLGDTAELYAVELPPVGISNHLGDWLNLLADLPEYGVSRLDQMIADFRSEVAELFPHTEILISPPAFLEQSPFAELRILVTALADNPTPLNMCEKYQQIVAECDNLLQQEISSEQQEYLLVLKNDLTVTRENCTRLVERLRTLVERIDTLVAATDFAPLYDNKRHLFSIGYSVEAEKLTDSSYDLLASEARLASYLGIVQRAVPKKHWFKLGRALSRINGQRGLVSWAGTMFEYLMPPLVMKNYANTLLAETYSAVIKAQIEYGHARRIPWGTSESGYYGFDLRLNYQYQAFGIPELGLKRGLINEAVVSPYSTLLALPFAPREALDNIRRLQADDLEGDYGLYEAVDYTPERLPAGEKRGVVRSFMAHHQGMGFVAILNTLLGEIMVRRFHANPQVRAGELLLQERIPTRAIITKENKESVEPLTAYKTPETADYSRHFGRPKTYYPRCHILSNGRYSVLLTDRGTGYSKLDHIQVTRWRDDPLALYGNHILLRNLNNNYSWSACWEPLENRTTYYRARFFPDRAVYIREDDGIDTRTQVTVSTEDNVEVRTVTLANHGLQTVTIELTSYTEPVLTHRAADMAHPGFSNLFVRTKFLPEHNALLASRRPRTPHEQQVHAFHSLTVQGEAVGRIQFESDRSKFLGRTRQINNPAALSQPLTNSEGAVLDPVLSLRRQIRLQPGDTATITIATGIAFSETEIKKLAAKYADTRASERAFALAYTRSQVEARYLNISPDEMKTAQELVAPLLFASSLRRRQQQAIEDNTRSQQALWAYGISGDNPVILVIISEEDELDVLQEVVRAHEYLKMKGFIADLVVLNAEVSSYLQPLHELIRETVQTHQLNDVLDSPGGIFLRSINQVAPEDVQLLQAVARVTLRGDGGPLATQIKYPAPESLPEAKQFRERNQSFLSRETPEKLQFANGYGGFSADGSEYIIRLRSYNNTPAPWVNVLANPEFGTVVSETGLGYTWAGNSRENKLTPWSNDPVSDPPGEVLYIRDEETGVVWTPTPLPVRNKHTYTIRHGAGYTSWEQHSQGLGQELTCFVAKDAPYKLLTLKISNTSGLQRQLSCTYYLRPVLGVSDEITHPHVVSEYEDGVLYFRNPYNGDFPDQVGFVGASTSPMSYTGDREEFIGHGGNLARPLGLTRDRLSGSTGAALDPCGALQVGLKLAPGEEKALVFMLGKAKDKAEARTLHRDYCTVEAAQEALEAQKQFWRQLTATLQVQTPDQSLNLMLNQWLLYQTLCCRIWARSGFYQCGGAFGFRDQLQDTMNLALIKPELTRGQILLHAAQQFEEGDVQHWWHPNTGNRGVRTRFSDDRLWLVLAAIEYIQRTGDYSLLEEEVPYLTAPPLSGDEDERYGVPEVSGKTESLYQHCLRALEISLQFGEHGLPLMGSGDWNDGMSTVGNKGQGESVWLGWFLIHILRGFAPICQKRQDEKLAETFLAHADKLLAAIEENGWDGQWYRRAYFDDGTPLGSAENQECTIDSLAQSWAVLAGGDEERARLAMSAVEDYLVRRDAGLVLLFTPAFDTSNLEPGYIKGYLPGVRENGGQYTHAAVWVINAIARMGKGNMAWELFHMINPVNHTRTKIECATYKVEPYVVAADVYNVQPHVGRGGWTWYTGAAGWLYRVGVEEILGFKKRGERLYLNPCIPRDWSGFELEYRYENSIYKIEVQNIGRVKQGVKEILVNGKPSEYVPLQANAGENTVLVRLGTN